MPRPITYPKSMTFHVSAEQLAGLREATDYGSVGAFVRAAAMRAIGRADLILDDDASATTNPATKELEPGDRRFTEIVWVALSVEQHRALKDAARAKRISVAEVARSSALSAAGMPATQERPKGTRGRLPGSLRTARKRRKAA